MAIQHLSTQEAFNTKIDQLETAASDSKNWINQNLQSSNKSGRFVRFLGTLLRAIGIDAFCHIRVNEVAHKMYEFAEANEKYLNGDNAGKLLGVMTVLNDKTHGQYKKSIKKSQLAINGILFLGAAIKETTTPDAPPPPSFSTPARRPGMSDLFAQIRDRGGAKNPTANATTNGTEQPVGTPKKERPTDPLQFNMGDQLSDAQQRLKKAPEGEATNDTSKDNMTPELREILARQQSKAQVLS